MLFYFLCFLEEILELILTRADSNGRTGWFIFNLELMKTCYPPINIEFTDRKAYYDALDSYAERAPQGNDEAFL